MSLGMMPERRKSIKIIFAQQWFPTSFFTAAFANCQSKSHSIMCGFSTPYHLFNSPTLPFYTIISFISFCKCFFLFLLYFFLFFPLSIHLPVICHVVHNNVSVCRFVCKNFIFLVTVICAHFEIYKRNSRNLGYF